MFHMFHLYIGAMYFDLSHSLGLGFSVSVSEFFSRLAFSLVRAVAALLWGRKGV